MEPDERDALIVRLRAVIVEHVAYDTWWCSYCGGYDEASTLGGGDETIYRFAHKPTCLLLDASLMGAVKP